MQVGESPVKVFLRYFIIFSIGLTVLQDIYILSSASSPKNSEIVPEPVHSIPLNNRKYPN